MSAMSVRNQRTLWKGVSGAGTVRLGRTSWTRSPYFIAHASRLPLPTHKKIDDMTVTKNSANYTREILDDARNHRPLFPVHGTFVRDQWPAGPPMVVLAAPGTHLHPEREAILLGFDEHMFDPLDHHLQVIDGCELRGDPWKTRCSWWHAGHPVAVLSGLIGRPVRA